MELFATGQNILNSKLKSPKPHKPWKPRAVSHFVLLTGTGKLSGTVRTSASHISLSVASRQLCVRDTARMEKRKCRRHTKKNRRSMSPALPCNRRRSVSCYVVLWTNKPETLLRLQSFAPGLSIKTFPQRKCLHVCKISNPVAVPRIYLQTL